VNDEVFVEVVAVGDIRGESWLPEHRGLSHSKRSKQSLLHELIKRLVQALLDDELQQVKAFAGVGKTGTGGEVQVNLLIGLQEDKVSEPGGMAEEHARCDGEPTRVMDEIGGGVAVGIVMVEGLGKKPGDRFIERKLILLNQLHDVDSEGALGNRGRPCGGRGLHRQVLRAIAKAEGEAPDDAAVVEDGDLGSGDVVLREDVAGGGFGFGDGDAGAIEAAEGGVLCWGEGREKEQHRQKKKLHGWVRIRWRLRAGSKF